MKEPTPFDHLLARYGLGESSDLYVKLVQATRSGHLCIDWEGEAPADDRLVLREGKLYLKAMDELEEKIARGLLAVLDERVDPVQAHPDSRLNEEQTAAFERVLHEPLVVISGGPGTGKSFTIEAIARAFEGKRVLIAAPTGKAVMQLESRLGGLNAHFSTLHKALGAGFSYTIPLDYDLVIIDEASMVDAHLWSSLFEAYMPKSRLVLVGDPNQLPPVECGHLFAEMVEVLSEHVTVLKRSLRTDRKVLIDLSLAALEGKMPPRSFFTDDPGCFDQFAKSYSSLEEAKFGDRVILCPLRKGPDGVSAINERIAKNHVGRFVPVLLKENHGDLVNGEMGVGFLGPKGIESTYFRGERCDGLNVELAFCLSVHKAQGSEFDSVLLAMPKGSEHFGRAALYTALTRAKHSIICYGSQEVVAAALELQLERSSGLKLRVERARQKRLAANGKQSMALLRSSQVSVTSL